MNAVLQGKWSPPDDHFTEGRTPPCPFHQPKPDRTPAITWGAVLVIEIIVLVAYVLGHL